MNEERICSVEDDVSDAAIRRRNSFDSIEGMKISENVEDDN